MRFYKIVAKNPADDSLPDSETKWVVSKADGVAARKALYDAGWRRKEVEETEVDVPTDKAGLLTWLNENVR